MLKFLNHHFLKKFNPIFDRLQSPDPSKSTSTEPLMIFTDYTAYGMALNAIGLMEDFFALLWTFFTFALFTIAFIIITATLIAVILAIAALVRYKRRGNFPFFRDPQRDLQHRRRHTRTRAKSCPKQCCYKPQVMQPPATLGMWK